MPKTEIGMNTKYPMLQETMNLFLSEFNAFIYFLLLLLLYTMLRLLWELTKNIQQGEQKMRGEREREDKTVGNRDIRTSVEGRGMGYTG